MNQTFIAREAELASLADMYQSPRFEMAVIYGRRRVGKTSLIKEFIKDRPAIYVQGIEATKELNLNYLTNAVLDFENPDRLDRSFSYSDFRDIFSKVQDLANKQEGKLIFVLDEFPYFAQSAPEISSVLQFAIDHVFKEYDNIMLILCGSSMFFMQHQVLGHQSPLYGRKTGQFKIRPFDIFDTKKMLPLVKNEDLLAYYGITGGIPQYLSFIDQDKSIEENINRLFLRNNAILQDEPNVLLQEELRKPATYYSILVALAQGKTKPNEIYQAIGLSSASSLSPYLSRLQELEMVERKLPILEKNTKNATYHISDTMFQFWFQYISGQQDKISLNRTSGLLARIMADLPNFLGPVFEKACKEWTWRQADLPFDPQEISSWWGYNPALRRQDEVDLVAVSYDKKEAIIGECKWRKAEKLSPQMLDTLRGRAALLSSKFGITKIHLYFFAKESSLSFKELAESQKVRLIIFDDFWKS